MLLSLLIKIQGIARKGKYGAFLMEEDSNRVREILSALRNHLPQEVAVSAKIRLVSSFAIKYRPYVLP